MSVVYLATQRYPERRVALKILASELASQSGFRDRFIRESNAAASFDHPNVIPIYGAGDQEGVLWIAMRYVEGTDLHRLIHDRGPLPLERTLRILDQVGQALDAAHLRGLVHRDVKPGNILIAENDHAYLTDFGITKRVEAGTGFTETGAFLGSVDYAAPEQVRGEPVDARADIYSLGCVCYECLTGTTPFPRDSEIAVLFAHVSDRPPRPSETRPGLPTAIDDVLAKSMAKRTDRRYESAGEMMRAADAVLGRVATMQRISRHARPTRRRRPRVMVGAVAAAALVTVVVASAVWLGGTPITAPSTPLRSSITSTSPSVFAHTSLPTSSGRFPEGFAWTPVPTAPAFALAGDQALNAVTAHHGQLVAVGYDRTKPGANAAAWTSNNGLDWQPKTIDSRGTIGAGISAAIWDGHRFVAVGGIPHDQPDGIDGAVWTSSADAVSWTLARSGTFPIPGDQSIHNVVLAGPHLVAVGWTEGSYGRDADAWVADNYVWSGDPPTPLAGDEEMWDVTQFRDELVAVGSATASDGSTDAAVWRLPNGSANWSPPTLVEASGDQLMKAVIATTTGLIAVGWDGPPGDRDAAVWTSDDGIDWPRVPGLAAPGEQEMVGVVPVGPGFVAYGWSVGLGNDLNGAMWLSKDGRSWKPSTPSELGGPGNQYVKGMVWADGKLVAVGQSIANDDPNAAVWLGTPIPGATPTSAASETASPANSPTATAPVTSSASPTRS
jgi:serine/threonine-protein kinase